MFGGDNTKITIQGYLKNKTENTKDQISVNGIKNKNKISYILNNEKYSIRIISPIKIILERENELIKNILYFEKEKKILSQYNIKENNINIDIDIITKEIEIKENKIKIIYIVNDSNNEYEYKININPKER